MALALRCRFPDIPQADLPTDEDAAPSYDYQAKKARRFERKVDEFLHGSPNPDLDIGAPAELPLDW